MRYDISLFIYFLLFTNRHIHDSHKCQNENEILKLEFIKNKL